MTHNFFCPEAHPCLGSPPPMGLFLFAVKKTSVASLNAVENIKAHEKTKHRLKIFLSKLVGWLGRWSPKNLLGRI